MGAALFPSPRMDAVLCGGELTEVRLLGWVLLLHKLLVVTHVICDSRGCDATPPITPWYHRRSAHVP